MHPTNRKDLAASGALPIQIKALEKQTGAKGTRADAFCYTAQGPLLIAQQQTNMIYASAPIMVERLTYSIPGRVCPVVVLGCGRQAALDAHPCTGTATGGPLCVTAYGADFEATCNQNTPALSTWSACSTISLATVKQAEHFHHHESSRCNMH